MAVLKPRPGVRSAKMFHRVGGIRVSALDASRAAFLEKVASTRPTEEVLRRADEMVSEVRAARDAAFLARYRRA